MSIKPSDPADLLGLSGSAAAQRLSASAGHLKINVFRSIRLKGITRRPSGTDERCVFGKAIECQSLIGFEMANCSHRAGFSLSSCDCGAGESQPHLNNGSCRADQTMILPDFLLPLLSGRSSTRPSLIIALAPPRSNSWYLPPMRRIGLRRRWRGTCWCTSCFLWMVALLVIINTL